MPGARHRAPRRVAGGHLGDTPHNDGMSVRIAVIGAPDGPGGPSGPRSQGPAALASLPALPGPRRGAVGAAAVVPVAARPLRLRRRLADRSPDGRAPRGPALRGLVGARVRGPPAHPRRRHPLVRRSRRRRSPPPSRSSRRPAAAPHQREWWAADQARLAALAAAEAEPRPYVHQMRGPRHRWWRPLLALVVVVATWLALAAALTTVFWVAGLLPDTECRRSPPTRGAALWSNLLLAALIPATLFGLWVGHRRSPWRVLSVTRARRGGGGCCGAPRS